MIIDWFTERVLMFRLFQKIKHFVERIRREGKRFPKRLNTFGWKVAVISFWDGIIPPGKSPRYIQKIENYVDNFLKGLVLEYKKDNLSDDNEWINNKKLPIWCCWWQGEKKMPEIVKMCHTRLKQVVPEDKAELYLITLDNYIEYVNIPEYIIKKFDSGIITMTEMSDILRFCLLEKYGGFWIDVTVFFTGDIPKEYFSGKFYCQRMPHNYVYSKREACRGNWCIFSMAGKSKCILFQFVKDALLQWWDQYDTLIDYVLTDYILMAGYKYVPAIEKIINSVPDNNEDIFEMYRVLNEPYSEELYQRLTRRNVMHKLTYKMELKKVTEDGQITLYGYLLERVYEKCTGENKC